MTIKYLTDDSLLPRLPRLGKLRKGGEKTPKGYGPDLDHFRFTSDNPAVLAAWQAAFPTPPRELTVYLPYATAVENFSTWVELWSASGLEHRCDGEMMTIWREGDKMMRGSKKCTGGHDGDDPRKDAVGRLEFVVPQLLQAGHVGTVVLETHSINDIVFIAGLLTGVEARNSHGLCGIAFRLYRQKESISVPGFGDRQGQRQKMDKWLVKIEPDVVFMRRELSLARAAALDLPAPEVIDGTTGEFLLDSPAPSAPAPRALPAPVQAPAKAPQTNSQRAATQAPAKPSTPPPPAKPANGNGHLASVEKLSQRWNQLWQWKLALGVEHTPIALDAKPETYAEAGKSLKAALLKRSKEILPTEFSWPDDDDTIKTAIDNLMVVEHADA